MAQKFGEFLGISIVAVLFIVFLALSVSVTYAAITWAFGLR